MAIPAVFCLTITLPVVYGEATEKEGEIKLPSSDGALASPGPDGSLETLSVSSQNDEQVVVGRVWNRWLTGVQCIFAPIFMTFTFFRISILTQRLINRG
jgi:hypothetical protein